MKKLLIAFTLAGLVACEADDRSADRSHEDLVNTIQDGLPDYVEEVGAPAGEDDLPGQQCKNVAPYPSREHYTHPGYHRHQTCFTYAGLSTGLVTKAKRPDVFPVEKTRISVGLTDDATGSVRDMVLSRSIEMAYDGATTEQIELEVFCHCLSFPTRYFNDDVKPVR